MLFLGSDHSAASTPGSALMPVATAPVVSLTVPVVTSTKLEAAVVVWPTDVAMSRVTCLIAFMIFSLSRMGPIPEGGGVPSGT